MKIPETVDGQAALVGASMGMTPEEFDAYLYRLLARKYADDVAQTSGETAVKQNREKTLKEMCESLVSAMDVNGNEGGSAEDEGRDSNPVGSAPTTLKDYGVAAGGQ